MFLCTTFHKQDNPISCYILKHSKLALIEINVPMGMLITKNGNNLDTQVYRKPTNTGLLLHFQRHTDLRCKKCVIKTMVHRAKELSSTHQAFVVECRHLKSMLNHLGYLSSLVNGIIDKCDYSSTLDAKSKSDQTLRVSTPFKDQVSEKKANALSQLKNRR